MTTVDFQLVEMEAAPTWATTEQRLRAPFGGVWSAARKLLEREVLHLDGSLVVVELTGPRLRFRNDGWISANSTIDPPVRVPFTTGEGRDLSFCSDRYDHWVTNAHAVGLTLDRLRAIDRYGCDESGRRYTGWEQLPASTEATPDVQDPVAWLAGFLSWDRLRVQSRPAEAVRQGKVLAHPDRLGGDTERMDLVLAAAQRLGVA